MMQYSKRISISQYIGSTYLISQSQMEVAKFTSFIMFCWSIPCVFCNSIHLIVLNLKLTMIHSSHEGVWPASASNWQWIYLHSQVIMSFTHNQIVYRNLVLWLVLWYAYCITLSLYWLSCIPRRYYKASWNSCLASLLCWAHLLIIYTLDVIVQPPIVYRRP